MCGVDVGNKAIETAIDQMYNQNDNNSILFFMHVMVACMQRGGWNCYKSIWYIFSDVKGTY